MNTKAHFSDIDHVCISMHRMNRAMKYVELPKHLILLVRYNYDKYNN